MKTLHYKLSQHRSTVHHIENFDEIVESMRDRVLDSNEELTFESDEETRSISRASTFEAIQEDEDLQTAIYNSLMDGDHARAANLLQSSFELLVQDSIAEAVRDFS